MHSKSWLFLAVLALCPAGAAKAKTTISLSRSASWEVSEGETCDLIGKFGQGADTARLVFTKRMPSESFDLTFAPSSGLVLDGATRPTVDFGPAGNPHEVHSRTAVMGDGKPAIQFLGERLDNHRPKPGQIPPSISPDQVARVDRLTITLGESEFRLSLGSMARPFEALQRCTDKMMQSWGYDPAEQASLSKRVEPANYPGYWVTASDYPAAALRAGLSGIVYFRLDIDAAGTVTACHIHSTSAPRILQTATCYLVQSRARFKPALDTGGNPVRSFYVNEVMWATPGSRPK